MLPGGIGRRSKPASAHMRKYSFANEQRPDLEKLYQLKRSNTIKEEVGGSGLEKESGDGGRLARIKRQIQSQWDQSTSGAHSAEAKYETMKDESPASTASNPDEADSDSASSSSTDFSSSAAEMAKQRLSPPTQVENGIFLNHVQCTSCS